LSLLRGIDPVQPNFHLASIVENSDSVAIGNRNDLGWPGKAGGRCEDKEAEKNEAGTVHAGLS
jgi:hypothetical protein